MPEKEPKINKKRIFCVITQGELGGAQQFVTQLAHTLNHDRFELHIVWGAQSGSALARHLPPQVSYGVVQHLVRPFSPLEDIRAVRELRAMIGSYRPDIVLCISSKAGFIGSLAAHRSRAELPGLNVIYRIGGWTFNDPWPAWKKKLYVRLEKFSARWKDYIVVNNTHDLEQARALGIQPRRNVLRIYNGVDPYRELLPRDQARAALTTRIPDRYQHEPYQWLVGTIANHYPAKDLATLIRAAAQTPDSVRFVVIGEGEQRAALESQIAAHGLEKRFFLVGSLSDAYKYLPALDVFALTSVKEGFPWAVLEAMAAKVAVVSTRVGALPEMIEDGVSGVLVKPGDASGIAKSIIALLENDRLRRELTIQAHQQILNKFSLREMVAEYEALFSER